MTLDELLRLPWSWSDARSYRLDGVEHWERRIRELPEFIVAAESRAELDNECMPALKAYLESFVGRGEDPPLPAPGRKEWVYLYNGLPVGSTTDQRQPWQTLPDKQLA